MKIQTWKAARIIKHYYKSFKPGRLGGPGPGQDQEGPPRLYSLVSILTNECVVTTHIKDMFKSIIFITYN